jgi:aconitate hydratase
LAGTVNIDFEKDPIGNDTNGKPVFLKDIWPSKDSIKDCVSKFINHEMFTKNYAKIA